jgi:hypothetical protein
MADQINLQPDELMTFWDKHRLSLLLILTVIISLILTVISMVAYNVSGTAQLDLSRPGVSSVSNQVDKTDTINDYSAFGPVSKESINEYTKQYDEQAKKAKSVDAFSGDPLDPEILEFGTNSTEQ